MLPDHSGVFGRPMAPPNCACNGSAPTNNRPEILAMTERIGVFINVNVFALGEGLYTPFLAAATGGLSLVTATSAQFQRAALGQLPAAEGLELMTKGSRDREPQTVMRGVLKMK